MIDSTGLLADARALTSALVDDLRERSESHDESRVYVKGVHSQATAAGRTEKSFGEWREDLLAQVAAGWVLGCVFVRFCEDNGLYDTPLLSGPGDRRRLARDHRAAFFADDPTADDRDWMREVFGRYAELPGTSGIFGERNPLWQLSPGPDGATALVELWWSTDDEGRALRHDFSDAALDTRFLGDLYQDLSEHARKQYALLQTPQFVEEFILNRTLDPAIETFGLAETTMIDPTCGSGHFLLGAFDRLLERWRQAEPGTDVRELAQRVLDAVNGVDINPFAVAIARFRLLVAALGASDVHRLADAPDFRINVAAGDSLLHGTRPGAMFSGAAAYSGVLDHHYPTEDAADAEHILQADTYSCVAGNPPYITVADPALAAAYRKLYSTCHREFQLTAPFTQRFFELARPGENAGFVGLIIGNAFMRRQFGTKLVEDFLPTKQLDAVIDTSGAYIPGHGTPTVILLGRNRKPTGAAQVRTVLGIRGEPGRPHDPANGMVWTAITSQFDQPGSESEYVSVADQNQEAFGRHPWSLQGGYAARLKQALEGERPRLASIVQLIGYTGQTNADPVFIADVRSLIRRGVEPDVFRQLVVGELVRDFMVDSSASVIFPYDVEKRRLLDIVDRPGLNSWMWPSKTVLWARRTFSKQSYREEGRPWWEWHQAALDRVPTPSIVFAFVATHNHFVLDRGGKVFKQSAPVIKLPDEASEDERLGLLGLLNSSAACFWMKQVFHNKGRPGAEQTGANYRWEHRYEFDATKLQQFPLPSGRHFAWVRPLDGAAQRLGDVLPAAVAERSAPTRAVLDEAAAEATALRARMVALQEELDWACYYLYGLTDEELTFPPDELPPLNVGQRAFEVGAAREGDPTGAFAKWIEWHHATPMMELPDHWPAGYRQLVEHRLEIIGSDRAMGLLERPEFKRRWYFKELASLEREAQRTWLLDRLEALLPAGDLSQPEVTTVARLADQLLRDDDARAVLEDLEGAHADPVKAVGQLVASAGVPYLAAMRLKESGLRTRQAWERTWTLQRVEDDLDVRAALPADHPDLLDANGLAVAKKEAGVDKVPVPPKYKSSDFRDQTSWRLRGKLDVPKERFVLYPGTHLGADTSAVVGWAGWDHLQQLRALAGLYTSRKHDGAEVQELTPMLAGMSELLPWVLQWHDDPDPVFGDRMGQYFTGYLDSERASLGLTSDDLTAWRP